MTARLITPPAGLAVTIEQARANLRVDGSYLDALITTWVEGITDVLEHEIGRAVINQGWRVTLGAFPAAIRLARRPIVSIGSIKYIDPAGVLQTLAPGLVDSVTELGCITPVAGSAWPATLSRADAVTVDYTCGYGPTPDTVPKSIKLYILAKLAEQFDPATRTERDNVQSVFVDRLLDGCRTFA